MDVGVGGGGSEAGMLWEKAVVFLLYVCTLSKNE